MDTKTKTLIEFLAVDRLFNGPFYRQYNQATQNDIQESYKRLSDQVARDIS
jgi:hypothetical protein